MPTNGDRAIELEFQVMSSKKGTHRGESPDGDPQTGLVIGGRIRSRLVGGARRAIAGAALAAVLTLDLASGAAAERQCEGPGINHRPSPATSDEVLSVIAYNVYLLPSYVRNIPVMGERFALAQEERAALIPRFLAPYDVVILSEAYDDGARATLLAGLRAQGFRYATRILGTACRAASTCEKGRVYEQPLTDDAPRGGEGDTWFGEDGGVLIASKHPIGVAKELIYADCVERDCNAAKGFVYARIDKGSARYHVIGTHAQFGWSSAQRTAKAAQFRAIRQFIEEHSGIPRSEPIIVGGDFNVRRHNFDRLLDDEPLGLLAPAFRGHRYSRESRSDWARSGNGYVDYVLAKKGWREPRYHSNCPMVFRSLFDFEDRTLFSAVRGQGYCDLSDHWAVWGYFDYRDTAAEPPPCPVPEFPPGSAPSMRR